MGLSEKMKFPVATTLELVQLDGGEVVLRPASPAEDESEPQDPLVSIQFSEELQSALGDDMRGLGQQMINAAIHHVMQKQLARWHANVLDEEPAHYS